MNADLGLIQICKYVQLNMSKKNYPQFLLAKPFLWSVPAK